MGVQFCVSQRVQFRMSLDMLATLMEKAAVPARRLTPR
jgi:hypothetical protein